MDDVVAALGQRLDDGRHGGNADLEPRVERNVDLGHRAQPAVDIRVGADHLHVEAAHAPRTDLLDRVGDAVHPADAVDDQRYARAVGVAAGQLGLLAPEERRRGAVGNRGHAGVEQGQRATADVRRPPLQVGHRPVHRRGQLALVHAAPPAIEIGVGELPLLKLMQQLVLVHIELHRGEPGAQQGERVARAQVALAGLDSAPRVALRHHPLDDPQHGGGIRTLRRFAVTEGPDGQRHRGVCPLGGAALLAVGGGVSGPDVAEELRRGVGARRLGERAADVDSGVVIGPSDGGSPVGLDVHERRQIQFLRPRAVAGLPDREQLGQPPPVARGERRGDGVERVRERGGDVVLAQVGGAGLDIVGYGPAAIRGAPG